MKITGPTILVMLVSITLVTNAQEAADADLQLRQKSSATLPPSAAVSPAEKVPELPEIDEIFKQTSLGKEADERRLHTEWRELSNRVVNDPDIVATKRAAKSARTDLEKRERLRDYYNIYYGRMRSMASSVEMKAALDQLKMAHLSQINQPRVRSETDAALPTPTPARKRGKNKKF
jgi:hypothetical protein